MGTSTDGQISYGILFPEDYEFPWLVEQYDYDIDNWWRDINGYVNPISSPFDDTGEYKPGYSLGDPRVDQWFDHRRDWLKAHPYPFEEVNYQSSEAPAYILAIPSTVKTANRGYPKPFLPESLTVSAKDRQALIDFCVTHGLEMDAPPTWYLSSYWG